MPAPSSATYSAAAKVAAHTAFRDLIDSGASAGFVRIRDASDVLLAEIPLDDPSGSIDGGTGQLTFDVTAAEAAAVADGTAAYAEFCDSDADVHLSLPAQAGVAPVSGYIVLNSLTIINGASVGLISATVG